MNAEPPVKITNVSIPHRQAKNVNTIFQPPYNLIKFQFLIGRLKTVAIDGASAHPFRFQFLIGRLKT